LRENTLPSIARALELGAAGVELDVHCSSDGVVVVHHDAELMVGDRRVPIAGTGWKELEQAALSVGFSMPRLEEVLILVDGRVTVHVEVKASGIEDRLLAVLSGWPDTPVHSFDHRIIQTIRLREPSRPVGVLLSSYLVDTVGAVRAADANTLWMHWSMIDRELVDDAHSRDIEIVAWTVNDTEVALMLARYGVDALCTDDCPSIATAVAKRST